MYERLLPAGPQHRVRVRGTDRADGDFRIDAPADDLGRRRQALAPGPWTWLRQVHGRDVVDVDVPGAAAGTTADAGVTRAVGAVLSVQTADCAPIVLASDGALAVVHAGWRGIVEGVIGEAIGALGERAAGPVHAFLGPCIGASAYEFGPADLQAVVDVVGEVARAVTAEGSPALDLGAAVHAQCVHHGVASFERLTTGPDQRVADTSEPQWFSHRTRGDIGRQVTVAWLEPA